MEKELKPRLSTLITLLTLITLITLFAGCKEKEEGCMDITASNWDAVADTPCESCCSYPVLKFSIQQTLTDTTTSFSYGDPLIDDFGNVYTFTSIQFYISNIRLKSNGTELLISDSIDLDISTNGVSNEIRLPDDFLFITKGTTSSNIGTFSTEGQTVDSLSFTLGISQLANRADPTTLAASHPLAPKADSMHWDTERGFIFQRIGIVPDTTAVPRDTILLEIGGDETLQTVNLAYETVITSGLDLTIPLKIDYSTWFTGINFADGNQGEWKDSIVSKMAKSFSIKK